MGLLSEDMPDMTLGAWLVPVGLVLLVCAGINALNSRTGEGGDYHSLATLSGVVTGVYTVRDRVEGRRVGVWLDTMPQTEQVQMYAPGVSEADRRVHAIPVGTRVTVHYDGYTQKVWALERADGGPGFSEADVRPWLADAHASERRMMHWLLGAGLVAIVAGIGFMFRDSS